jgi:hypothetical protein
MKRVLLFLFIVMIFIGLSACKKVSSNDDFIQPPDNNVENNDVTKKPKVDDDPQAPIETPFIADPKLTLELSIYSQSYGNSNGNLNNQSLALYDTTKKVHYYSAHQSVYQYNPSDDQTESLFSLTTGGRPIYLNIDQHMLYFIDSSNGYMMSFNLETKSIETLLETENIFLGRHYSYLSYIYIQESYGSVYHTYKRLAISDKRITDSGTSIEFPNYDGSRVYYKQMNSSLLRVMDASGMGKSTIVDLKPLGVDLIYESLFYFRDQSNFSHFMLILEKGSSKGLYRYNQTDGLVKIMDAQSSHMHSLNFDGTYFYVINGSAIYKIDKTDGSTSKLTDIPSNLAKLQIINHWFYLSEFSGTHMYRIHPVTLEVKLIS